ncbi:response regulator [Thiomicrorhabdus sp. Milos-T2]|uniref:response regulator n=1 Tax=Thiomicrorhabdus sp. Milos-T2 TaxID=90814 RepID=UPI000494B7B7|nr:response regulator [Thiomicrorhabdus sp. Milos-T2]
MAELQKILYAEDEPDIQSIAQMALEMMGGYTLKLCQNGQQAVEAAEEFAPDLILLDVMMPTMDGPTALQEIRKIPSLKNTPVIFMTAKVQQQEVENYKALGAIDVIPKPFDPMTLPENVKALWQRAVS